MAGVGVRVSCQRRPLLPSGNETETVCVSGWVGGRRNRPPVTTGDEIVRRDNGAVEDVQLRLEGTGEDVPPMAARLPGPAVSARRRDGASLCRSPQRQVRPALQIALFALRASDEDGIRPSGSLAGRFGAYAGGFGGALLARITGYPRAGAERCGVLCLQRAHSRLRLLGPRLQPAAHRPPPARPAPPVATAAATAQHDLHKDRVSRFNNVPG